MNTTLDTGLAASALNGGSYRPNLSALKPLYRSPMQHAMDSRGNGCFGVDHVVVETAERMSRAIFGYLHERDGFHKPAQLYVDPREVMTNRTFMRAYRLAVSGRWLNPEEQQHLLSGIVGILAEELKPDFFKELKQKQERDAKEVNTF
ncbi:hypothetical protein HYV81_03105 [Candidatus Woesearchaeota archaeon]|nr:hypothetical protein [Candidatus Woesearchaeota archaeon]